MMAKSRALDLTLERSFCSLCRMRSIEVSVRSTPLYACYLCMLIAGHAVEPDNSLSLFNKPQTISCVLR